MENMATTSYAAVQENSKGSSETTLILNARKGDLDAFNQLVLSYQDRIYSLAARILGDQDLAEDIAQNTFLTAYLNLPSFRNGSFRGWIYRIATNLCYDVYRRNKRYPVSSLENEILAEERISPLHDFSSSSIMPEMEVERHELEQVIQQALDRLDADQRTIIVLIDQQDFNYAEAAQVLGIPVGTVKSRLARARLRLRQLLSTLSSIMQPVEKIYVN